VLQTEPHADLLQAVKTMVTQTSFHIDWHHVKGHQDGKLITVLPWDVWLNIEANLLTKSKVDPTYCGPTKYHLPGEGWVCSIGSQQQIVKHFAATIQAHANRLSMAKYWKTKFCLLETLWHLIDWQGLGQAYSASSMATRQWAVKHIGFLWSWQEHGMMAISFHLKLPMIC